MPSFHFSGAYKESAVFHAERQLWSEMFRVCLFVICDQFLLDFSPNYSRQLFSEHRILPPELMILLEKNKCLPNKKFTPKQTKNKSTCCYVVQNSSFWW